MENRFYSSVLAAWNFIAVDWAYFAKKFYRGRLGLIYYNIEIQPTYYRKIGCFDLYSST